MQKTVQFSQLSIETGPPHTWGVLSFPYIMYCGWSELDRWDFSDPLQADDRCALHKGVLNSHRPPQKKLYFHTSKSKLWGERLVFVLFPWGEGGSSVSMTSSSLSPLSTIMDDKLTGSRTFFVLSKQKRFFLAAHHVSCAFGGVFVLRRSPILRGPQSCNSHFPMGGP